MKLLKRFTIYSPVIVAFISESISPIHDLLRHVQKGNLLSVSPFPLRSTLTHSDGIKMVSH